MCTPHPSGLLPWRKSEPTVPTFARRLTRCLGGDTPAALNKPEVQPPKLLNWRSWGPTDPLRRPATGSCLRSDTFQDYSCRGAGTALVQPKACERRPCPPPKIPAPFPWGVFLAQLRCQTNLASLSGSVLGVGSYWVRDPKISQSSVCSQESGLKTTSLNSSSAAVFNSWSFPPLVEV
eukprot:3742623-Amphidinium_carterae.1